jgi:WD40 repeat protein/predicted SprT family Zn-dependent metalloprotease
MYRRLPRIFPFLLLFLGIAAAQDLCPVPDRLLSHKEPTMFTEEQELILGDVEDELFRRSIELADSSLNPYLQRIGDRLVAQLPQTKLKFTFRVVDSGEWNAFTTAGGRVYMTRKLITTAKNEDEIASVLAHEIGHTLLHHQSSRYTKRLEAILGVYQVTDRKDIEEKIHRLEENWRKKQVKEDVNSEEHQRYSDLLGIYIAVRAGYKPEAFGEFWDRVLELKGKTGGGWSDFFGRTTPEQKRLRGMLQTIQQLPSGCRSLPKADADGFLAWQKQVIEHQRTVESTSNQAPAVILKEPLRAELDFLRYSPDGKYVFAQDENGISVLQRSPLKVLFSIDAPDAHRAKFSPDSQAVVFDNAEQRVERWNVLTQKREFVREVWLGDCAMNRVSPDGKFLACLQYSGKMRVGNTETGAVVYESKGAGLNYFQRIIVRVYGFYVISTIRFTEDSRYLVYKFSDQRKIVDLSTFQEIKMQGDIDRLTESSFDLQGSNRLLGVDPSNPNKSAVLEFPSGRRLFPIVMGNQDVTAPTRGDWVLIGPAKKFALALVKLKDGSVPLATKTEAIDVYEDEFVNERKTGEVGKYKIGEKNIETLEATELPINDFSRFRTIVFSPDGKYLALSTSTRGAVWNLRTGDKTFFLRNFDNASFVDDRLYLSMMMDEEELQGSAEASDKDQKARKEKDEKPKKKRVVVKANLASRQPEEVMQLQHEQTRVIGKQLVSLHSTDKDDATKGYELEIRSLTGASVIWSRHFQKEPPDIFTNASDDTLGLVWSAAAEQAKIEILGKYDAYKKFSAIKNKERTDLLIEVVELSTGKLLSTIVIESGEGSFLIQNVFATKEHLIVGVNRNRVLIYSLATGEIISRTFGTLLNVDRENHTIYLRSDKRKLVFYDIAAGKVISEQQFEHPVVAVRPVAKEVLVITGDQKVHRLATSLTAAEVKTASN